MSDSSSCIDAIRIERSLADTDLQIILDSRRPRPSFYEEEGWIIVDGFLERSTDREGPRLKTVPAEKRQDEIVKLASILCREGWTAQVLVGGHYNIIEAELPEEYIKELREDVRNERVWLLALTQVERPYGPDDFIEVSATIASVCTGCGHEIYPKEKILWAPDYKTPSCIKGESFHLTCEPGPTQGRSERWEQETNRRASRISEDAIAL